LSQMDRDQINTLAEKIAEVISAGNKPFDLATLSESIGRISERLDRLEASNIQNQSTWAVKHPSQDKFAVAEAIVDRLFDANTKEKTCTFEPNDRPCDHCSMCSSRGF